jgi:hypothetical protein
MEAEDAAQRPEAGRYPQPPPAEAEADADLLRLAPRPARPRDVRGVGFPSPGAPLYGGRCLNALSRKVETPFPTLDADTRRRVEEFIGCTCEQSYSEFTVELKNAVHRLLDDIARVDQSKPARHRSGGWSRRTRSRRVA